MVALVLVQLFGGMGGIYLNVTLEPEPEGNTGEHAVASGRTGLRVFVGAWSRHAAPDRHLLPATCHLAPVI